MSLSRRIFTLFFSLLPALSVAAPDSNKLSELSIAETQAMLSAHEVTVSELVNYYQNRITQIDKNGPGLNSIARINPDIITQAAMLDAKIDSGESLGKMFGVLIVVKDNIDIKGMPNTAGSWLMQEHMPAKDAFLIKQLLAEDALILAKTNLSEWANFRSTKSSSGWSSLYGQTLNPHDTSRSPCGSSSGSGVAIAADLALVAIGTETDGSVTCPAAVNGIVGIKPTLGLVSRSGIIPIAHSQDTAGPMTRSVTDAVILLDAMSGKDANDPDSMAPLSILSHLKAEGLKGKRIGIVRNLTGYHPDLDEVFEQQLALLKKGGAILVDNANLETENDYGDDEYTVLLAEFKADLNAYLNDSKAPLKSLQDAISKNEENKAQTMPIFGQEIFLMAQDAPDLDEEAYLSALKNAKLKAGKEGIDATLAKHKVDLLIAPTTAPAWKIDPIIGDNYTGSASSAPAVSGYPHISVPMGLVHHMPVNISFFGAHSSEPILIEAAYAYEQLSQARVSPELSN